MLRATRLALLLTTAALLVGLGVPADAAVGDLGHDVSQPQCGAALPGTGTFGVVGVHTSKPFTANPCLVQEWTWATGLSQAPALYATTANPGPSLSTHWPAAGTGACVHATSTDDPGCSYEYGRAAANEALQSAATALSGGTVSPTTVTWWLDVEGSRIPGQPGNTWVGSGRANTADLQGFVDALRAAGVPEVGLYSTSYQWNDITGGYTRSTSGSYRAGWPFGARFPLEDSPVWLAGTGTTTDATARCATASFTGGERLLAQFSDSGYDGDRRCADPDRLAPTAALSGPGPISLGNQVPVWSGADQGGSGLASFDVSYEQAQIGGAFGPWLSPTALQRTSARTATVAAHQGSTACYRARSRDAAGNLSPLTALRCTVTPLDDTVLAASAGWVRTRSRGYYLSTYTSTSSAGVTLTRKGVQSQKLTLLALRCPTCGKVGVYLSGHLLVTVDLRASTNQAARIALPRFTLRTTDVVLKTLTAGKVVRIDGLASSRV